MCSPLQQFGPRRHAPFPRRDDKFKSNDKSVLNAEAQKAIRREQHQANRRQNKRYGNQDRNWNKPMQQSNREASVDVGPGWSVKEQIDFKMLAKLSTEVDLTEDVETLKECGSVRQYDKQFEKLTAKTCKTMERAPQEIWANKPNVTASDDPVLQKFARETDAEVFATDQVVAVLMAAPRSVYSWDIVATKTPDGKIWLDKRPNSVVDYLSVNETANEPPSDDPAAGINHVTSLAQEATLINLNFGQHLLQKKAASKSFGEPTPFHDPSTRTVECAYRYRQFDLDGTELVVRCELDAVTEIAGKEAYVKLCAVNEYDSRVAGGVDWRRRLDTQNGAVLAAELKNNSNKLAIWTCKAFMSGADHMRMGFVSRVHPKDCFNHSILKVQQNRTTEFASQINLNLENSWGIVKGIIDLIDRQEPGKFVIVRDPNKPILRMYSVPMDAFDVVEDVVVEEDNEDLDYDNSFGMR